VGEVQAGYARRRRHREVLGEADVGAHRERAEVVVAVVGLLAEHRDPHDSVHGLDGGGRVDTARVPPGGPFFMTFRREA
jgi:hypothetical protein